MKVELGLDLFRSHVDYDCVSGIVASSTSTAEVHLLAEDVRELACDGSVMRGGSEVSRDVVYSDPAAILGHMAWRKAMPSSQSTSLATYLCPRLPIESPRGH